MRVLAAVLLLTGSLAGCVGDFSSRHIEAEYHSCLAAFVPLAGVKAADWDAICETSRRSAYDYRLSTRRFVPRFPQDGGGSYQVPTQVIIMN